MARYRIFYRHNTPILTVTTIRKYPSPHFPPETIYKRCDSLPMVQIIEARVVNISTARDRVRTVNRSDSQKILQYNFLLLLLAVVRKLVKSRKHSCTTGQINKPRQEKKYKNLIYLKKSCFNSDRLFLKINNLVFPTFIFFIYTAEAALVQNLSHSFNFFSLRSYYLL